MGQDRKALWVIGARAMGVCWEAVSGEGAGEEAVLGSAERGICGVDWTESGEQEEGLRGSLEGGGTKMEVREGSWAPVGGRGRVGERTPDAIALPASPGAAALMLLLPATMFHLLLAARSGPARLLDLPPYLPRPEALWSPRALLLWLTWLGLQVAFYLLPARKVWTGLGRAGQEGGGKGSARRKAPSTIVKPFVPADG